MSVAALRSLTAAAYISITKLLGNIAIDEQSYDLSTGSPVGQTSLPSCRNLVSSIRGQDAVLPVEGWKAIEIIDQAHIISFHGNTGRDQNGPSDGLWIEPDALPQRHLVLLFRRIPRVYDCLLPGVRSFEVIICREMRCCSRGFDFILCLAVVQVLGIAHRVLLRHRCRRE